MAVIHFIRFPVFWKTTINSLPSSQFSPYDFSSKMAALNCTWLGLRCFIWVFLGDKFPTVYLFFARYSCRFLCLSDTFWLERRRGRIMFGARGPEIAAHLNVGNFRGKIINFPTFVSVVSFITRNKFHCFCSFIYEKRRLTSFNYYFLFNFEYHLLTLFCTTPNPPRKIPTGENNFGPQQMLPLPFAWPDTSDPKGTSKFNSFKHERLRTAAQSFCCCVRQISFRTLFPDILNLKTYTRFGIN